MPETGQNQQSWPPSPQNQGPNPALPASIEEADKLLRKRVIGFTVLIGLLLILCTAGMGAIGLLHLRFWQIAALSVVLIGAIMAIFFTATGRTANMLISWGRNFNELGRWEDTEMILSTFNQFGQRFLDPTGEAHFLLMTAFAKRGKRESADKVRDFLAKHRAGTVWGQKAQEAQASMRGAGGLRRSEENSKKPSKGGRRRF